MNLEQLKKNVNQRVQIRPVARRFDTGGQELEALDDDWVIEAVTDDGVRISNIRTAHITTLGRDHIHHYTSNPDRSLSGVKHGFLTLNVQIILRGTRLIIEPNSAPGQPVRMSQLEERQRHRTISAEQHQLFIELTKAGPFGPVCLATRTAFPGKEQEDFTIQLRGMLDAAGFGTGGSNIVNGFSTGVDSGKFLLFVSSEDTSPIYFSNLASALFKLGLVSPDVPIAINNPNAKPDMLYLSIPELV